MNGAHLKGAGGSMAQPARGMTGANLPQGEAPQQSDPLAGIFAAADAAGVQYDPTTVMQDPRAMQAVLGAAAQSDYGATDMGAEMIDRLAQQYGVQSPFQQGGPQPMGGPGGRQALEAESMRRAGDPNDELFGFYDRATNALENEQPGAEALGGTQRHLRNYYELQGRRRR